MVRQVRRMKNSAPLAYAMVLVSTILLIQACDNKTRKNEDIFAEMEGKEGVYIFKVPASLFLGMVESETLTDTSKNFSSKDIGDIDMVKLMLFDSSKSESQSAADFSGDIFSMFSDFGYEPLVTLSSGGTSMAAYVLEDKGYVSDLMVVIRENESVIGIGLTGKLNAESILSFASEVDYTRVNDLLKRN